MGTIREAVIEGSLTLGAAGCQSPRFDAEALLCHLLDWKPHQVFAQDGIALPDETLTGYRALITRRASREPLQHIVGSVCFLNGEIRTGPDALIPRPETEYFAELLIEEMRRHTPESVLEIGTGAGPIAVSLAAALPDAIHFLCATDICLRALGVASLNLHSSGLAERVHLVACDLLDGLRFRFDALVANLPYVPTDMIDRLEPEVRFGDPRIALDGGSDGLELLHRLTASSHEMVRAGGLIALETGLDQADAVAGQLSSTGMWGELRIERDLTGRQRYVFARRTDG